MNLFLIYQAGTFLAQNKRVGIFTVTIKVCNVNCLNSNLAFLIFSNRNHPFTFLNILCLSCFSIFLVNNYFEICVPYRYIKIWRLLVRTGSDWCADGLYVRSDEGKAKEKAIELVSVFCVLI